jgi:hypothetical protein
MSRPSPDKVAKTSGENPPRKAPTFKYRPRWGIVVECESEKAQRAAYRKLKRLGYKLKVVCV